MAHSHDTILSDFLKDPKALEALEKFLPGAANNPALKLVEKLPLGKLAEMPQTGLSLDTLKDILAHANK